MHCLATYGEQRGSAAAGTWALDDTKVLGKTQLQTRHDRDRPSLAMTLILQLARSGHDLRHMQLGGAAGLDERRCCTDAHSLLLCRCANTSA